jgi:hypothetical protein
LVLTRVFTLKERPALSAGRSQTRTTLNVYENRRAETQRSSDERHMLLMDVTDNTRDFDALWQRRFGKQKRLPMEIAKQLNLLS